MVMGFWQMRFPAAGALRTALQALLTPAAAGAATPALQKLPHAVPLMAAVAAESPRGLLPAAVSPTSHNACGS